MSRFALLLLSSALMLVIAACDTNGDDDAADDFADDTTTIPADDATNGADDFAVPEDDEPLDTEPADDALGTEADDADAVEPADDEVAFDDGATDPDATDEEMAFDDEEIAEPSDEEMMDPTQGMFFDLTVEEANDMTDFEIVEPGTVPESLEFQGIIGMAAMAAEADQEEDEAATIVFTYQQAPDEEMMQGLPLEFTQSTELDMREGLGPEIEAEDVTVGDREVTRIHVMQETGDSVLAFAWEENNVFFSVAAILGGDLDEAAVEEMVASIPAA